MAFAYFNKLVGRVLIRPVSAFLGLSFIDCGASQRDMSAHGDAKPNELPASRHCRRVAFELPSSSIQAERCNVTLLSADLRNFTAIGESRPSRNLPVLHYFLPG